MMFRHWFAPPLREDEYETFAARVLHYTLLLLICVVLMFGFLGSSPSRFIYILVILVLAVGSYSLLHSGRLYLASLMFVGGLWLFITIAVFENRSMSNALISSYVIVIIFSAILFPERKMVFFTGLSIVSSIILTLAQSQGISHRPITPIILTNRFFQQIVLLSSTGILLWVSSRMIRRSLLRIRTHEKTLVQRNQALEQEIAERQHTEANLRISEAKYRLLFENIPVMAGVYGQAGEIVLLNKAAAQTLGGTSETLQGRNLYDVLTVEDAKGAIRDQTQVMSEGKEMLIESNTTLPDGREIYFLRHIMPLPNMSNPGATQVLVLTTDLTAKHRAEQREHELARANERNAFLTDFFSTLSHDIKTPLTVMNTSLYLLKHAATDEQREDRIARISEQVALMDKYIQDMLTISRLEHVASFNFKELELNPLIDWVVDVLHPRIEGKQITFQFEGQPNLPTIQGDEEQLRRMLMNLIENAVNYTPVGGRVTVKTQSKDRQVLLEVKDSGIGIEPAAVPHIFERFFRAANATAFEQSGTGLGLAIVKKIVETHSATIEVGSQLGEGTTFSVQFS